MEKLSKEYIDNILVQVQDYVDAGVIRNSENNAAFLKRVDEQQARIVDKLHGLFPAERTDDWLSHYAAAVLPALTAGRRPQNFAAYELLVQDAFDIAEAMVRERNLRLSNE